MCELECESTTPIHRQMHIGKDIQKETVETQMKTPPNTTDQPDENESSSIASTHPAIYLLSQMNSLPNCAHTEIQTKLKRNAANCEHSLTVLPHLQYRLHTFAHTTKDANKFGENKKKISR